MAKMATKRKTTKNGIGEKGPSWAARGGRAVVAAAGLAIRCLPLFFILAGVGYGCWHLWRLGLEDRAFRILPSMVVSDQSPCHPEANGEFSRLSDLSAGRSLLDPLLLSSIRDQYARSVWVKKVCRVERVFPNQVMVEFIPRRAFVQARQNGYYWLVDDENVLLPVDGTQAARAQLPVVEGDLADRPRYGEKWNDPGVTAATDALAAIENSPLAAQLPVRTITVRRSAFLDSKKQAHRSRPRLEIRTHTDINILWGCGPDGYPGEITTADKIVMLRQLLSQPPANRRKISLDVRTAVPGYKLRGGGAA